MKDIEFKISQFIDNELSEAEQKELFGVLAEDQKARQMLADYMMIKRDTSAHYNNITAELAPLAISQPYVKGEKHQPNIYKVMFYFSAAAAVILILLLAWNQSGSENYHSKFSELQTKYESLKTTYDSSLQQVQELKSKMAVVPLPKSNIIRREAKHEIIFTNNTKSIRKPNNLQTQKYLANLPKITPITISKEDFIGGQIVGN